MTAYIIQEFKYIFACLSLLNLFKGRPDTTLYQLFAYSSLAVCFSVGRKRRMNERRQKEEEKP